MELSVVFDQGESVMIITDSVLKIRVGELSGVVNGHQIVFGFVVWCLAIISAYLTSPTAISRAAVAESP